MATSTIFKLLTPFKMAGDLVSLSGAICAGCITSSQKEMAFFVPYGLVFSGSASITALSVIVRTAQGGYPHVRSGSSGATYTQLGPSAVSLITSGAETRTNEISSFSVATKQGSGFYISLYFNYALCTNTTGTSVTNNQPIIVAATLAVTLS